MECHCMNDVYMPTIVITIILEFSIGLQNGFWDIFLICSTCFYFAVLTRKVVPLMPLHFLSNMSSHNTSPYIFITSPFGPCASNIFGDPCNALHAAVSSYYKSISRYVSSFEKYRFSSVLSHIFSISSFPLEIALHVSLDMVHQFCFLISHFPT